jgi:endonuclease/exonuclease/phosphatase family metal-dependent hydrolase
VNRTRTALVAVLLALLVWVLALALVIGWALVGVTRWAADAAPARTMPPAFTEATLNVLYRNTAAQVGADVRAAMARASIVRLQEVYSPRARAGVRRALAAHPTWSYYPRDLRGPGADVVLWSPRWVRTGPAGTLRTTAGVRRITPSRYLVWVTLARRVGPRVPVTVANTHAVSGYCHRHATRPALRDAIAARHWTRIAAWTQHHRTTPRAPVVLLGGDFNCSPWATGPGTPGQYLRAYYALDSPRRGIDRLLTSRTPGAPVTIARWSRPARSDHRLHLRTLTLPR